jgi:hypothetical protein
MIKRAYLIGYWDELYCQGDYDYEYRYILVYATSEHWAIKAMEEKLNTREWEKGVKLCTIEGR